MKTYLSYILLLLGAVLLSTGCQPGGESTESSENLIIGMDLSYPPFEMKDANGDPAGVSVDLAYALGEHLGKEIEIQNHAFEGIIPAVMTGRADLVISSITRTEERAESIDFSDPYVKTGICLLVQKDSDIESFEDLNAEGRRIAVKLATTGHIYSEETLPEAEIAVFRDAGSCALEVAQGRADAFLYDQISIYQFWKQHQETTRPILTPVREEYWAIGIRKGNDELREQVNAFLKEFRESGGFERIGEAHVKEFKQGFEEMGVSFIF